MHRQDLDGLEAAARGLSAVLSLQPLGDDSDLPADPDRGRAHADELTATGEAAQALQWTIAAHPPGGPEAPPDGGPAVMTPDGEQAGGRRR